MLGDVCEKGVDASLAIISSLKVKCTRFDTVRKDMELITTEYYLKLCIGLCMICEFTALELIIGKSSILCTLLSAFTAFVNNNFNRALQFRNG